MAVYDPLIDFLFPSSKKAFKNLGGFLSAEDKKRKETRDKVKDKNLLEKLRVAVPESLKSTGRMAKFALNPAAELSSYAVPFGKGTNVLAKFLAPGAVAGGLDALSQDKNVLAGGATGLATGGLLGGAGKLTGKAGKTLSELGDKLTTKALRPSPSQQANFLSDTGEKLSDFLKSRKLIGNDYETLLKKIEPLQKRFDKVATDKKIQIPTQKIKTAFEKEITRLNESILPANKSKAEALKKIADDFTSKFAEEKIGADVLTELRKEVDKNIKDFSLDPAVKGPLNLVRDVLQGQIRDASDKAGKKIGKKTLKQAGTELSKLYKVLDISEKQQFLGGGAKPVGLTNLLGAGAGGAAAGLPGLVGGYLATSAMNSPQATSAMSKAASSAGDMLSKSINPKLASALGMLSTRGAVNMLPNGGGQMSQQQMPTGGPQTTDRPQLPYQLPQGLDIESGPSGGMQAPPQQGRNSIAGITKDDLAMAMLIDLQTNQGRGIPELQTIGELIFAGGDEDRTEKEKQLTNAAEGGRYALSLLEGGKVKTGPLAGRIESFKSKTVGTSTSQQDYLSTIAIARSALLNAYLGGNIPPQEYERIAQGIPSENDPPETAKQKLKTFIREIERYSQ